MFEAFQVGPFTLWIRLLFLLAAIWVSSEFFFRLASAAGLSLQHVRDFALAHALAFLLGGRLVAVLASYQAYIRDPLRIGILWDGEFSFVGAAIGVAVVLYLSTSRQRATFLQWLDVLLPAAALGLAIDWLGMFFGAHAYGKPTNVAWAVTFNTFDVRYTVPVHPVQLYYSAAYFCLAFILLLVRRYSARAGAETLFGIVAASTIVFFFEFLRGDVPVTVYALATDIVFLALLVVSLGVLALLENRLSARANTVYSVAVVALTLAYVTLRPWIDLPQYQMRFSQILAILALLATVVYVVVHRRKYPHL